MKNKKEKALLTKVENLSEEEKLDLFSVEELENRLEMAASSKEIADIDANGVCWIG